jgi:hypothetical protein
MVTDFKDKQFHEGTLRLNADDVDTLARVMQDLTDDELDAESEASMLTADDSRLDRELFEQFAAQMSPRSRQRDPSCLDDKQLWSRISEARNSTGKVAVRTLRPRQRGLLLWTSVAALAAGLFLAVRLWESDSSHDPSRLTNLKGVDSKDWVIKQKACILGFKSEGTTSAPEVAAIGVPGSRSILLMAQCMNTGYLHLQLVSGSDRVIIGNIPVEKSDELQELRNQKQELVGVMTPKQGSLQITYGLSKEILNDEELIRLDAEMQSQKPEAWLWMREVRWPILGKEAKQ